MNLTKLAPRVYEKLKTMEKAYPDLKAKLAEVARLNNEAANSAHRIEREMDRLERKAGSEWERLISVLWNDAQKMWNLTEKTQIKMDNLEDEINDTEMVFEMIVRQLRR